MSVVDPLIPDDDDDELLPSPDVVELVSPGREFAVPAVFCPLDPGDCVAPELVSAGLFTAPEDDDADPDWSAVADDDEVPLADELPADPDPDDCCADATTVNEPTVNAADASRASVFRDSMRVVSLNRCEQKCPKRAPADGNTGAATTLAGFR